MRGHVYYRRENIQRKVLKTACDTFFYFPYTVKII